MNQIVNLIKELYPNKQVIPLHEPCMGKKELDYVSDTIRSTFVSSNGEYINKLEQHVEKFTRSSRAVATVNGTSALHACLYLSGVRRNDLVITQALTFVATCNAIRLAGAEPILLDVSLNGLGLCSRSLEEYLEEYAYLEGQTCRHKLTKQCIKAVVPMHTFGHPVDLDEILRICEKWCINLIEDAAESLGSFYKERHTGTYSQFSAMSFNGNKIITTGGGGMILCDSVENGDLARHVTTTSKQSHDFEFFHDQFGFNYRMPNLNAALGCAQIEKIEFYIESKRKIANEYENVCLKTDFQFIKEPSYARSNYWINGVVCENRISRDLFIRECLDSDILVRPVWQLMHTLPMYKDALKGDLSTSEWLVDRIVNLPSTPILEGRYG
ncbi:MAG: LegC family aminotransferase [Oceanospirillaceae bacterium]|nr:LegC family aminotransferase [Oceanospirillaceae bacterium]